MKKVFAWTSLFPFLAFAVLADNVEVPNNAGCLSLIHTDNTTKNICEKEEKPYLLLEFFSAYCGHCRRNVEWFKKLEEATSTLAHSRLVSLNTKQIATLFGNQYSLVTDIAVDATGSAAQRFGVRSLPSLFVLNSNNEVIFSHKGVLNDLVIERVVGLISGAR